MIKNLSKNQPAEKLQFFPENMAKDWGCELPMARHGKRGVMDSGWPECGPDEQELINQLEAARRCWVRTADGRQFEFLVGPYHLSATLNTDYKGSTLLANPVRFARTGDRRRILSQGVVVRHEGVLLMPGTSVAAMKDHHPWSNPHFIARFADLVKGARPDGTQEVQECSEAEVDVLDCLENFIEAEHEVEERVARQTPPFYYQSWTALDKQLFGRQHFRIQLSRSDHERMVELKPALLAPVDAMGEPSLVRMEISELEPVEGQPLIDVSVARQTDIDEIPRSGELLLAAIPTQRNVRLAVLDQLRENKSTNPWLLPLMAGEYRFPELTPENVPIPSSPYQPTDSQRRAIDMGAGTPDLSLVLGPPGTGKTTVIVHWANYFVKRGLRVLVASQSNKAVDNVLERLADEDGLQCVRLGNESRISSSLHESLLDNRIRQIQRDMLDQEASVSERISRVRAYLTALEDRRGDLDKIRSVLSSLEGRCVAEDRGLGEARNAYRKLSDKLDRVTASADQAERRYVHLRGPRWHPLIEPIRKMFVWPLMLKSRLAGRKRRRMSGRLKTRLVALEQELDRAQHAFDAAVQSRNAKRAELEAAFPVVPLHSVGDLPLPTMNDFDWGQVAELQAQLDRVTQCVAEWYGGLRKKREILNDLALERVNVVGATCIGINTKEIFRKMTFDVVIVDESGQIQAHNLIVPLSRAARVIMVGDHKQLPPVVQDEIQEEIEARGDWDEMASELFQKSWFELLWDRVPENRKVMLDTQFRCPAVISDYVSDAFYEGEYRAGHAMKEKGPLFSFTSSPMIFVDTSKIDKRHEQSRRSDDRLEILGNETETRLIVNVLEAALIEMPDLAHRREIGIIVPYANHVKRIQKLIQKRRRSGSLKNLDMPVGELVASVDSFQGQERDLVIFTFTRSNSRGAVGFLADWRRLNVAMTRARKQLIMIGDSKTLARKPRSTGARDAEFKHAVRKLRDFCQARNALISGDRLEGLPSDP